MRQHFHNQRRQILLLFFRFVKKHSATTTQAATAAAMIQKAGFYSSAQSLSFLLLPPHRRPGGRRRPSGGEGCRRAAPPNTPFVVCVPVSYNPFIAGHFDISAQEPICKPAQRIKPIGRKYDEAQRLPPMVATFQMCVFVSNNIFNLRIPHRRWQIDLRAQYAENKGSINAVAEPDIITKRSALLTFLLIRK